MAEQRYILGHSEEEYERLRAQARFWEPMTARMLADAGLAPGMRCLDVGCGPGEVMRLMGEVVGRCGEVTGVDIDVEVGRHAAARLNAAGGASFRFFPADITGDAPIPGAPFDFVFARFLLLHLTDPGATVRRLAALTRPGGRLVLMDFDLSRMAVRPENARIERALAVVTACFERSGKAADVGLRLPELMLAAGLSAPRGFAVEPVFGPFPLIGPMLRDVLGSLAPAAEALGVASRAEVAELIAACHAAEAGPPLFALGPALHCSWTIIGER
jgi:SAM-dependent methyltransferase